MAQVHHVASLVTTDNATSYTTPAFTPEAGDLIAVVHTLVGQGVSDWLLGFSYASLSDSEGGTYNEKYPGGAFDTHWGADFYFSGVFSQVREAAAPASSMTVTLDLDGHTALGCTLNVFLIKNPLYYGNAARRQAVFDSTHDTSDTPTTPTLTFGSTTLASSVVLGYVGSRDPSPLSAPTGLGQYFNDAHTANDCGAEIAAAMGWVGTVLTWGGSTIRYRAAALELYTTGVPHIDPPEVVPVPEVEAIWINSYAIKVLTG